MAISYPVFSAYLYAVRVSNEEPTTEWLNSGRLPVGASVLFKFDPIQLADSEYLHPITHIATNRPGLVCDAAGDVCCNAGRELGGIVMMIGGDRLIMFWE